MMKTIIAGGRNTTILQVEQAINACSWTNEITEVVSGKCRGADEYGENWAKANLIPVKGFPADWDNLDPPCVRKSGRNGKIYNALAGPNRNREMANYADALIAIWNGQSSGTANMINEAKNRGLKVFVHLVE